MREVERGAGWGGCQKKQRGRGSRGLRNLNEEWYKGGESLKKASKDKFFGTSSGWGKEVKEGSLSSSVARKEVKEAFEGRGQNKKQFCEEYFLVD